MSPRGRAPILLALLAVALVVVPAPAVAQDVARIEDRILDPAAHARITYENAVNVASYQQDGILTHNGHQYTAWYENDGPGPAQATAVIARARCRTASGRAPGSTTRSSATTPTTRSRWGSRRRTGASTSPSPPMRT
jgi:hypothetical protein